MNKIAIPALLLGVVMIAGAFAFMPVQEASTVHLSAAGSSESLTKVTAAAVLGDGVIIGGTTTTLTCPNGCIVYAIKVTIVTDDANDELNIAADSILVDGQAVAHEIFNMVGNDDLTEEDLFATPDGVNNISDGAGEVDYLVADTTVAIPWLVIADFDEAGDTLLVDFYITTATGGVAASAVTAG